MPRFQLANDRLLQIDLQNEKTMLLAGSMVAYEGSIKFEKAVLGGESLLGALKRRVANEGFSLMTASGVGTVYCAHEAREITILPMQNKRLLIESSSLLAFDGALRTNTVFAGLRGATTGQGLFTTSLEGSGNVAIMSDGSALMLQVGPHLPLCVDPDAFLGYEGNLQQEFIFDANWKTMIGQTSGETFQLKFTGSGIVYIQPAERK